MNIHQRTHKLTECDREPIHNIGKVQPFGGLLKLNGDWIIAHRSLNCAELLALERLPDPGTPLASIFASRSMEALRMAVGRIASKDAVERIFGLQLIQGGDLFDCAVHSVDDRVIVEFEKHDAVSYNDHASMIGPILSRLEPLRDPESLCKRVANLVRDLLGYDRVMVYQFHHDDSGEVIAEAKRDDLEPYLGLRYPRTDIPHQARELFRRNKFRVIANVDDEPIAVEPSISITGKPLDMSMSMLRASSRTHIEYLVNMGVKATLTIAVVRQNKLWGLISCHHYEPRLPSYSLRTLAELLSQVFSLMLDRLLIDKSEQLRTRGRHLHDQLMLRLAGGASLDEALPFLDDLLDDVIPHDGASVLNNGEYNFRGAAPTKEQFAKLLPALSSAPNSTIIVTPNLSWQMPEAEAFADHAAGALIMPISRRPRDYLILWRKPLSQKVIWAGNPVKAFKKDENRLEPRASFAAWEETVEGRSADWTEDELQIAEGLRVTLLEVILRMTDETARERARAQEQQELLIAELNHRVRNILNLIRSLVTQSQDDAISVSQFAKTIGGRISALASAHDNITRENWSPAQLSNLFRTEVAAYINEHNDRVHIHGADVLIKPEAYTVLALVIHELVTNSAKYGSLCDRSGSISVTFLRNRVGDFEIQWREIGGPPVQAPTRRGFGSTIIERSIPYELKGDADVRFKLTGLEADFVIPAHYIVADEANSLAKPDHVSPQRNRESADKDKNTASLPQHVLVVEDSIIIALDTEENLKRLGVASVLVQNSVKGALAAIEERQPDFAIVDYNLGNESSEAIAATLKLNNIPFVLATGYAEMANQIDRLGAQSLLRKPYGRDDIENLLKSRQWDEQIKDKAIPLKC